MFFVFIPAQPFKRVRLESPVATAGCIYARPRFRRDRLARRFPFRENMPRPFHTCGANTTRNFARCPTPNAKLM